MPIRVTPVTFIHMHNVPSSHELSIVFSGTTLASAMAWLCSSAFGETKKARGICAGPVQWGFETRQEADRVRPIGNWPSPKSTCSCTIWYLKNIQESSPGGLQFYDQQTK